MLTLGMIGGVISLLVFGATTGEPTNGAIELPAWTTLLAPDWSAEAAMADKGLDSTGDEIGAAKLLPVNGLNGLTPVIAPTKVDGELLV
jgi:hypothetical protein